MSKQVKRNTQNPLSSLHHSGLIKILVCYDLEKRKDMWISFLNRNCFGFSSQDAEITSKFNSLQENDKEERLSDEDNRPLSNQLKEIIQNKLIQKQSKDKMGNMKSSSKNKKGPSTSKLHKSNRKQKKRQCKDVSTDPIIKSFELASDIFPEASPITNNLIDKLTKRKRKVVTTSSEEEIPIGNISHQTPLMRRVTRSMVKKKYQAEQRKIAPIFIEDSSPER